MNVIEAYIKFKGQMIIFISGMSGSGISALGLNIGRDFKLPVLNTRESCTDKYNVKAKLHSGIEVTNWDTDDVYDWIKINEKIETLTKENKGVIIVGTALPDDKIKVKADFHIHIKLSKQNLLARRVKYADEHIETCNKETNDDPTVLSQVFNTFTFPYYLELAKRSVISKYINANEFVEVDKETYNTKVYDEAYNYLIFQIQKYLKTYDDENGDKNTDNKGTESNDKSGIILKGEKKELSEDEENDKMGEDISSTSEGISLSSTSVMDEQPWIWRPIGKGQSYNVTEF